MSEHLYRKTINDRRHGQCTNAYHLDYIVGLEKEREELRQKIASLEKQLEVDRNGYHQDRLTWNAAEAQRTERKIRPLEDEITKAETRLGEAEAALTAIRNERGEFDRATNRMWTRAHEYFQKKAKP